MESLKIINDFVTGWSKHEKVHTGTHKESELIDSYVSLDGIEVAIKESKDKVSIRTYSMAFVSEVTFHSPFARLELERYFGYLSSVIAKFLTDNSNIYWFHSDTTN